MTIKLSIVILSYNTLEVTRQCLQSLRKLTDLTINQDFEVIVVDNDSRDGSSEMIKTEFPEVKLIESKENLGFARGNNLGVKYTDPKGGYVLFLNSDTIVPTGTLVHMLRFMEEHPDVGLSTCKVVLVSGEMDMDSHRGFPTPWVSFTRLTGLCRLFPKSRLFNYYYQGWKDLNTTHEVDCVVGAFMLVARHVGEKFNWWDEDYFLNGEDIEFCFQVKKAGFKVMYHPDVSITHYRGASKGTRKETQKISKASREGKVRSVQAGVDAMQLFYNKHYRTESSILVNGIVDLGLLLLRVKRRLLLK